jgi:polysaccharide export outer membrane protein
MRLKIVPLFMLVALLGCAATGQLQQTEKATEQAPADDAGTALPKIQLSEFVLGPGDSVEVQVWRHPDLSRVVEVQTNGFISYPLIGNIQVAGMGLFNFQNMLSERLTEYITSPQVMVQVRSAKSHKIFILGEVRRPGVFLLDGPMTALEALAVAGGPTLDAKTRKVFLIRNHQGQESPPKALNMSKTMKGMEMDENVALQSGDILYVPPSNMAYVDRFFRHLATALGPIVSVEQGIVLYPQAQDVLTGKNGTSTTSISPVVIFSPTSP